MTLQEHYLDDIVTADVEDGELILTDCVTEVSVRLTAAAYVGLLEYVTSRLRFVPGEERPEFAIRRDGGEG